VEASEQIENLGVIFRGDADAVIADQEPNGPLSTIAPYGDAGSPVRRHKFDGVVEEIDQDVIEKDRAAHDDWKGALNFDLAVPGVDLAPEILKDAGNDLLEGNRD